MSHGRIGLSILKHISNIVLPGAIDSEYLYDNDLLSALLSSEYLHDNTPSFISEEDPARLSFT